MAGALGLVTLATGPSGASAAVDGTTAAPATYLSGAKATVTLGSFTHAIVTPVSGSVGVHAFRFAGGNYATGPGWATLSGATAVLQDGIAPAGNDIGITSTGPAVATVRAFTDANSNGVIDVGESSSPSTKTINFVDFAATTAVLTTASPLVAQAASTTYTVRLRSAGGATVLNDDKHSGLAPLIPDVSIGGSVDLPPAGSPAGDAGTVVAPGLPIERVIAIPNVGATGGATALTGFVDPTGAAAATAGARTATGSFTISSQVASAANSTIKITGSGVVGTGPYLVPQSTATTTVEITILDSSPAKAPVANANVVVNLSTGGILTARVNGGAAAALPSSVNVITNAAGRATVTVEVVTPITTGLVTASGYSASIGSVASGAVLGNAALALFTAAGTVAAAPASSAMVANTPADGGTILLADGTDIPVSVRLVDTLGNPAASRTVSVTGPNAFSSNLTTNASGIATTTIPGSSSDGTVVINSGAFSVTKGINYGPAATVTPGAIALDPTPLPDTMIDTKLASNPATNLTAANVAQVQVRVKDSVTPTAGNLDGVPVTFSVTNGRIVSGAGVLISTGTTSSTVQTAGGGLASVSVASEGTGAVVVTATAGAVSTTASLTASNAGAPVSSITVAPAAGGSVPASVVAGSTTAMTARVVDANGNPLAGKLVEIDLTGAATIASNGSASAVGTSNSAGRVNFSVVAGATGSFTVRAASEARTVTSPSIRITAAPTPVTKTVTIGGERNGARLRVQIAGSSEGFAKGTTVTLFVKVRGTSGFTARATQTINESGEFVFNPKIRKGFTAFARIEATNSNRILVRAAS